MRRNTGLRHKSGSWVWVLAKGKVIARDTEGRPLRIVGTHLDITERKRAEEALRLIRDIPWILLSSIARMRCGFPTIQGP